MDSFSTVGHVGPTYIWKPLRFDRFVGRPYVADV